MVKYDTKQIYFKTAYYAIKKRVNLLILRYKLTEALGIIFIFIPKIFAASIPEQRGNLLSTIQPLTNGVDAR